MSTRDLWAHTPRSEGGQPHSLQDHSQAVGELCAAFGSKLGHEHLCRFLGLAHDSGKANPAFQAYLRAAHEGKPAKSVPHSLPGAAAFADLLGLWSMPILAHHGGLHDATRLKDELPFAKAPEVEAARLFLRAIGAPTELGLPEVSDPLEAELLIRLCLSALVDADRLDTAAFTQPQDQPLRQHAVGLQELNENLTRHLDAKTPTPTPVGRVRREVLADCRAAADLAPGFFRLTVPTGGGKTLSSMAFALAHALRHDLDRVIVAIPFTSIIEQTADVYRQAFECPDVVLEHHSARESQGDDEGQSQAELRHRLLSENWDAPVIVTTTVQLFESLFSNHPRQVRKLHNVARSVIVLDEAQALPVPLLQPIVTMLKQLVESYGVTVVLCSATLPDFSALESLPPQREIVGNHEAHFAALKRVSYTVLPDELELEDLADRLQAHDQVLCILNSRPDAVRVAEAVGPDTLHLSTSMCPAHRRQVLAQVRDRLKQGSVRLVSTQVVEAGVDLDFPAVFRAAGPLDSVIQAAGRCNREGLRETGECTVFRLSEAKMPTEGTYPTGTTLFRTLSRDHPSDWDTPDLISNYFRQLFGAIETDQEHLNRLRQRLQFKQTAREFRMIDDDTDAVLVARYLPEVFDRLMASYHEHVGLKWYREARQLMVSLRRRDLEKRSADIETHESGLLIYRGPYSHRFGIGSGTEFSPEDLVR